LNRDLAAIAPGLQGVPSELTAPGGLESWIGPSELEILCHPDNRAGIAFSGSDGGSLILVVEPNSLGLVMTTDPSEVERYIASWERITVGDYLADGATN
jgi:hypothetical protein